MDSKTIISYKTNYGQVINGTFENFIDSNISNKFNNKVQLILTSPPFPLNKKKKYGNLIGTEYLNWFSNLSNKFKKLLSPDGSIVIEIGNSWKKGYPTMSTLALESLLQFKKNGDLHLCQQFICSNPARLPSPAQWVNIERIRVKDSYTNIWWMSPNLRPKANNRNILQEYSDSMKKLLKSREYNSGLRPSGHKIGKTSFLKNNKGSIPSNVITLSNTSSNDKYSKYCKKNNIQLHPARMNSGLAEYFINFLTEPGDIVLDPFAGSNTTGFVAETLKRKWISIEPVKEYIDGSIGRFY